MAAEPAEGGLVVSRRRPRWTGEGGGGVWPAVSDLFIGFLALVMIVAASSFQELSRQLDEARTGTQTPPPRKEEFKRRFEAELSHGRIGDAIITKEEFAAVNLRFPASLLFGKCVADLNAGGKRQLERLRDLFAEFEADIERVEVTGHTDPDPPSRTGLCAAQGITTNWQLSARRSISVVEVLAPDDGSGLAPRKIWAAALASHHPIDPTVDLFDELVKRQNRRIEVLIKFFETEVGAPPPLR